MAVYLNTSMNYVNDSQNFQAGYPGGYGGANVPVTDANSLIYKIMELFNAAVWLLISLAVVFIVWKGVQFIRNSSDPKKRTEYGMGILWGVVGLFLILSLWGLVNILGNTFGTGNANSGWQSSADFQGLMLQPGQ